MIQTRQVIARLHRHWPNLEIHIEEIHTRGDQSQRSNVPLTKIGGDGVFVTEIEHALSDGRIDLAVHSLKDLPTAPPEGLTVLTPGPREDIRDVLVSNVPCAIEEQHLLYADRRAAPRIGTCSLRRMAQIRVLSPEAQVLPLRGNVDTRLRKLANDEYDSIILASAGLHRLELQQQLRGQLTYFPAELMLPAPGQGALGLEVRDEPEIQALLAPLKDLQVQAETTAERMFMRRLGAGCYLPVAAYGRVENNLFRLDGLVISTDGQRQVRVSISRAWSPKNGIEEAALLGQLLAEKALSQGADTIIQEVSALREQEPRHV